MNNLLTAIQIVSILQGLFLGFVLLQKRKDFIHTTFVLLFGILVSFVLFSIGDDSYNLIFDHTNWFFFHEPLIITLLFLLVKYLGKKAKAFKKVDFLFFIPYGFYALLEALSNLPNFQKFIMLELIGDSVELLFIGMLFYSVYEVIKYKKAKWLLFFLIPFTLFFTLDEMSAFITGTAKSIYGFDSYGVFLIIILLFYYLTYKLIFTPKEVLPTVINKYNQSKLDEVKVISIKNELIRLMVDEKLFTKHKLTVDEVANKINISRQQLSEVLSMHMQTSFQELLSHYRVEEFVKSLQNKQYDNFTLFGIANEVGFSSKSSFNAVFKRLKGVTPSQYKKQNLV